MTRSSKGRRGGRRDSAPEATSTPAPIPAQPPADLAGLPPLYTLKDVARHLSVSRSTLRRMVNAGSVPVVRVGGQLRFDILAVRAAIDRHR